MKKVLLFKTYIFTCHPSLWWYPSSSEVDWSNCIWHQTACHTSSWQLCSPGWKRFRSFYSSPVGCMFLPETGWDGETRRRGGRECLLLLTWPSVGSHSCFHHFAKNAFNAGFHACKMARFLDQGWGGLWLSRGHGGLPKFQSSMLQSQYPPFSVN